MKNFHHLLSIALFFSGLILITGCNRMEAPTSPTAPTTADADQQSLLKSGHNDDNDDRDRDDDGRRRSRRHRYKAVAAPGITWSDARTAATAMKRRGCVGHLATITSQKENDFIVRTFPEVVAGGYWLGGFQPPGSVEPGGGWKWITSEPFIYTNWSGSEPNDLGDENALHFSPPSLEGNRVSGMM